MTRGLHPDDTRAGDSQTWLARTRDLTDRTVAGDPSSRRVAARAIFRRLWARTMIAATILGAIFVGPWGPRMLDLEVYRVGARALLSGNDIYLVREATESLPFTYPVFAAVFFAPFALLPVTLARAAILFLSLGALALVCATILRTGLGLTGQRLATWTLPATLVAVLTHPVLDTLIFGQINIFLLALVLSDALLIPPRYRGVLVGLATGIKLTPGLFIVYYAATGQWRAARTAGLTFIATVLIGFLAQPVAAWTFWTNYVFDPHRAGGVVYVTNQSILGTVARLTRTETPPRLVTFGLALVVIAVVLPLARRLYARGEQLAALCAVGVGALLVSPISWSHHWVWSLPCLVLLFVWARQATTRQRRIGRWSLFTFVALVVLTGPMRYVPKTGLRELHHNVGQQIVANSYTALAIAFLIWMTVIALRRQPARLDPR